MVLTACRGAVGFLTRFPVGLDDAAWNAFRDTPGSFPIVGYGIGALVAIPLLLPVPPETAALGFVVGVYVVTGFNHIDGLGDFGDALAVHAEPGTRREAMQDTEVGVGAVLAIGLVLLGLFGAGIALARLPFWALGLVIAGEVGAKLAMAGLVCFGTASHPGLGAALTSRAAPGRFVLPAVLAVPAAVLTWPNPAGFAAVGAALIVAIAVGWWSRTSLGGVSGDVMGAANELARVAALHAGVIAWTRW